MDQKVFLSKWIFGVCLLVSVSSYVMYEVMTLHALVNEVVERIENLPEYTLLRK